MNCPVCHEVTELRRIQGGAYRRCPQCLGRWMALSVMRQSGERTLAMALWDVINAAPPERTTEKRCGSCDRQMLALGAADTGSAACKSCQMLWIHHGDLQMPEGRAVGYQLSPEKAAQLEHQSFAHLPDKAAESNSALKLRYILESLETF